MRHDDEKERWESISTALPESQAMNLYNSLRKQDPENMYVVVDGLHFDLFSAV